VFAGLVDRRPRVHHLAGGTDEACRELWLMSYGNVFVDDRNRRVYEARTNCTTRLWWLVCS
jgi:hypothetical protein